MFILFYYDNWSEALEKEIKYTLFKICLECKDIAIL